MKSVYLLFNHLSVAPPVEKQGPQSSERQLIVHFPSDLVHMVSVIIFTVLTMYQASDALSCH